jgi:hypothetical protein
MVQILEREILNNALADLRSEGFEVLLSPTNGLVPSFLGDLRPDAIATKGDQGIIVEVVMRPNSELSKIKKIREALLDQKDWQLRILLLNGVDPQSDLPLQTIDRLKQSLDEIEKLKANGFEGPSLLVGWATFEAIARTLVSGRFAKPQSPKRIVDQLAEEGFLTPDEADQLRKLADKRNRFIHGDLDVVVNLPELDFFIVTLKVLALESATQ